MKSGVYGLGRFGSFWSELIRDAGPVVGYNRTARPAINQIRLVDLPTLAASDTIWLCNAISAMPEVCRSLAPLLGPNSLVIDTCSVKVFPVTTMLELLPPTAGILATHPMFGPDSAKNGLKGLAMVCCPIRASDAQVAFWADYFTAKGLKILYMTPDEHDRAAARTQGLTHFIGRLLAEFGLENSDLATLGFRKLTEVMEQTCNDPWQLFLDLQAYNPYCAAMRAELLAALSRLQTAAGFIDS